MEWSTSFPFDADSVPSAPNEPGVYEISIVSEMWAYENSESPIVYLGAGPTPSQTVRRLLIEHLEGRGNTLLHSLDRYRRLEFRYALVANPPQALFELLTEFKKKHGGMPVCNRVR